MGSCQDAAVQYTHSLSVYHGDGEYDSLPHTLKNSLVFRSHFVTMLACVYKWNTCALKVNAFFFLNCIHSNVGVTEFKSLLPTH